MPLTNQMSTPLGSTASSLPLSIYPARRLDSTPGAPRWSGEIIRRLRHICLYARGALAAGQSADQARQPQKVFAGETALACRSFLEDVGGSRARPPEGDVLQSAGLVAKVDAIFAPRLLLGQELELASRQRVERVDYPDARRCIVRIGCSRVPFPRAASSG